MQFEDINAVDYITITVKLTPVHKNASSKV